MPTTTYSHQYRFTATPELRKSLEYIRHAGRRAAIKRVLAARDPLVQLFAAAVAAHGFPDADIQHTPLRYLDNSGEPCTHCDSLYGVINIQAYYQSASTGLPCMEEGCTPCIAKLVAADADADHPVTIESEVPA